MTDKLFFSYSRFDSNFVLLLANDLRNAGAHIWLDQLDIPPGEHWDSEIEKALNSADCLLVIISPSSLASDNAMDEVSYALEKKKRVIPIMLTNADTPFRLRRLQRIDFTGDYHNGFKLLKQALKLEQQATPVYPIPETQNAAVNTRPQMDNEEDLWNKCWNANTVAAYQAYLRTTSSKDHLEEAWKRLDMLQEKPLSRAIKLSRSAKSNASAHGKKFILGGASLVLLAGITWGAYKMVNNRATAETAAPQITNNARLRSDSIKANPLDRAVQTYHKKANDSAIVPAGNDYAGNRQKNEDTKIKQDQRDKILSPKLIFPSQNKKKNPYEESDISAKQPDDNDSYSPKNQDEPILMPALVPTSSTTLPPAVERVRTETTKLRTSSDIDVNLLLIQTPNMDEKKKTDQHVKFRVMANVEYQGQIIIRQGALVNGTLTIGRIHTDIEMKNVQAANGRMIKLKSKKVHGRRNEVETNKNYIAVIEKGTHL